MLDCAPTNILPSVSNPPHAKLIQNFFTTGGKVDIGWCWVPVPRTHVKIGSIVIIFFIVGKYYDKDEEKESERKPSGIEFLQK